MEDFQHLLDSSSNGCLVHDAKSKKILWANRTACEKFRYTVDELCALKAHHMSAQDPGYRRATGTAWLQAAVVYGRDRRLWKYADRDGMDFMTDATATLVHLRRNDVILVEFRVLDRATSLPDSSRWMEYSLDRLMWHTSSGLLLMDNDNRVVDVSPFAAKLMGSSVTDMLDRTLDEIGEIDSSLDDLALTAEMEKVDGSASIRMRVVSAFGEYRWLSGYLENIIVDGNCIRVLTVRDISTKVQWEERNAYQEKNLQYLSRTNAMGDMAMILAHDLGQPIAAATNYLDGARRRLGTVSKKYSGVAYGLEQATVQLDRVADIVSAVKKYVRRIESVTTSVDLNATVRESLYFVKLRAADKGITVSEQSSGESLMVVGDCVLIGQVIINICINAIDEAALPTSGAPRIEVSAAQHDGMATVTVRDYGRGMTPVPADMLAAGAFSSKDDGSGIGLIISEHIVQRHGGTIVFDPATPRGTAVRINIPLSDRSHRSFEVEESK